MFPRRFLERIRCPYCGGRLQEECSIEASETAIRAGVVRCACNYYPLLEGILLLRPDPAFERARDLLLAGDAKSALLAALPAPRSTRARRWLGRLAAVSPGVVGRALHERERSEKRSFVSAATFLDAVMWGRLASYGYYLYHRYANPNFLAAIPALLLFRAVAGSSSGDTRDEEVRPVLDLSAGAGHASYLLRLLRPEIPVVSADMDFLNLALARRFLLPEEPLLCLDAEHPLPFTDDFLGGIYCGDAFYCYRAKTAVVRELERTVAQQGIWAFPRLWNAAVYDLSSGFPMTAEQYMRCFERANPVLLPESFVFDRFMREQCLDLTYVASPEELAGERGYLLLASRSGFIGNGQEGLGEAFTRTWRDIAINPIYRVEESPDHLDLRLAWPPADHVDRSLQDDCAPVEDYLPESCRLDQGLLQRLGEGTWTPEDAERVARLLCDFVLVRLPPDYGHRSIAVAQKRAT